MLHMIRPSMRLLPFLFAVWCTSFLAQAANDAAIRINAGGDSFTDTQGQSWQADYYYSEGITNSNSYTIQNTPLQSLYSSERVSQGSTNFRYDVPVSKSGYYLVKLHFAEIRSYIQDEGERVFHVNIQGSQVWNNLDVYKEAGGAFLPLVKSHVVQVTSNDDELISIEVIKGSRRNPKLSGIEILPSIFDFYVNAGSENDYVDIDGNAWLADDFFNAGTSYTVQRTIDGTDKVPLYQSERYQRGSPNLQYSIPVPSNGNYFVKLHFSDNYKPRHFVGGRVFGVALEGTTVANEIDLFQQVGAGFTAVTKSWLVQVNDNMLDIEFLPIVQNPTIAAIEVHGFDDESATNIQDQSQPTQPTDTDPTTVNNSMDFEALYINAGSDTSINDGVNVWREDMYHHGGRKGSTGRTISNTPFGELYQTYRKGHPFEYEIPIPNGSYEVVLHFAETEYETQGARQFHVYVEGSAILTSLDIYETVGGFAAYVVTVPTIVRDDALSIEFVAVNDGEAILCSFSVTAAGDDASVGEVEPHYAHAVPGGPYFAVADSSGKATVEVDGYFSHTHLPDASLVRWTWMINDQVVGDNAQATSFELSPGEYELVLEVQDSGDYTSTDYSFVTVKEYGYPDIHWISPSSGDIGGGNTLKIGGAGFTYSAEEVIVYIGSSELSGNDLEVSSDGETIEVASVPPNSAGSVDISVKTPSGWSTSVPYTYVDETLPPIRFNNGTVDEIRGPTCLAFGPDGKLYIGTQLGRIVRLTIDDNYQVVDKFVSTVVADSEDVKRTILDIAFDPTDTCQSDDGCKVYVSHSYLFHGELSSPNGKVSAVTGQQLDKLSHLITGLPVSDHDHGVAGLVFGHEGELYIQIPGNTNAGVPGSLSKSKMQKEEFFSSSTVVAVDVNSPDFDGHVTYDEHGNQITGMDVSVYAPGQRNSMGIVLHSNGYLYATDNGANRGYGLSSVDCTEDGPSPEDPDELNVVIQGNYYGHPNRKRGENDPRQCIYRGTSEMSDDNEYTGPIAMLPASSNGLCEFETEHFAGQLRGNLIVARWKGELYNVVLTEDGLATKTGPFDIPPVLLEEGGLDVVQGPDGTLFTARHIKNQIRYYSPDESTSTTLKVKSAFPRRGPRNGGTVLSIYGDNLYTCGVPTVKVGGNECKVNAIVGDGKITCKLPQGEEGVADILVTAGMQTSVLTGGYRYIKPAPEARIEREGTTTTLIPSHGPSLPTLAPVLPRIEEQSSTTTILASLGVRDLVWVDAMRGKDLRPVTAVCNNCFDLSNPVTIRADSWGDVNSVKMTLDGSVEYSGILNDTPYALFRTDERLDYQGMIFPKGNYTVTAQAFSKPNGQGPAGQVLSIAFGIK